MAQSYLQIQRQIETLQRQAEKLKTEEIAGVVSRIKVAISHYGLTAEQLGFGVKTPRSPKAASRVVETVDTAKYADGKGNEWAGRGPRPHWLRDALASGKALEDFATANANAASPKPKAPKTAPKRTAKRYSDGAGNSWSGFGPKPRWLKEALAAGGTLDQYAAK
jgi:DNA-binding protein H-NS